MSTVFTHTTVVTVDAGQTVLHDVALAVDGDKIGAGPDGDGAAIPSPGRSL